MATFTVELYRVVEMRGTMGLDNYPIFDPAYRAGLNKKIYEHFIDREIGQENVPRWLHAMERKMNEIMPLYNQLYESQKLAIDPLNTISMETVANALGAQTSAGTSKSDSTDKRTSNNQSEASGAGQVIQSEFAQTILRQDKDYATTGSESTNKSNNTAVGTDTGTGTVNDTTTGKVDTKDSTDSKIKGWQGSQAMLLAQFRATFLNIDMDIINDLEEMFMWVWTSGDSYAKRQNGLYFP